MYSHDILMARASLWPRGSEATPPEAVVYKEGSEEDQHPQPLSSRHQCCQYQSLSTIKLVI